MKRIITILLSNLLFLSAWCQVEVYNQPLRDIEGNSIELGNYLGKKLLFIVLPMQVGDTAVQQQLLRFQERYDGSTVQVIGLAGVEEGYDTTKRSAILEQYAENRESGLVITEGLLLRKSSGEDQTPLLQWLTRKERNQHFDIDADEAGKKFFVSETGSLFAVLDGSTSLDVAAINRVMNASVVH